MGLMFLGGATATAIGGAVDDKLNFIKAYKEPLTNPRFMRLVITIFFVGFSVFGSFTYSGKLLQEITGYNLMIVGLVLSLFGIGTVVGGAVGTTFNGMIMKNYGTSQFFYNTS